MIHTMTDVWVDSREETIRWANQFAANIIRGANIIRPYWKAFSLRPSPEMARRDM